MGPRIYSHLLYEWLPGPSRIWGWLCGHLVSGERRGPARDTVMFNNDINSSLLPVYGGRGVHPEEVCCGFNASSFHRDSPEPNGLMLFLPENFLEVPSWGMGYLGSSQANTHIT